MMILDNKTDEFKKVNLLETIKQNKAIFDRAKNEGIKNIVTEQIKYKEI